MTRLNQIWAIGIALVGTWFGISVMFGHIPGLGSDIGTFRRVAALTQIGVNDHGYPLTGFATMIFGYIMGVLCLFAGESTPDTGQGTD